MSKNRPPDAVIQGYFCPLQPEALLARRLRSGKCQWSDVGLEKLCAKCSCYWPMDTEFWFASGQPDGLFNWCRACYLTYRWPDGRGAVVRAVTTIPRELEAALA